MVTHYSTENKIVIYSGDITKAGDDATLDHSASVKVKVFNVADDPNPQNLLFEYSSPFTVTIKDPCYDTSTLMDSLVFAKSDAPSTPISADTIVD